MYATIARLLPLFERERAAGRALVLATVVRTAGSTYAKAGAPMLIAADGEYAGLLSGGCLEGDLREHARQVFATGEAKLVSYDMRTPDDLIFGLGAGCEGAMDILLQRLSPLNLWQPLARIIESRHNQRAQSVAVVVRSTDTALPLGTAVLEDGGAFAGSALAASAITAKLAAAARAHRGPATLVADMLPGVDVLLSGTQLPPRVLLLGGGPDAIPVVELVSFLGWKATVFDHRPSYAQGARFPLAERVVQGRPEESARLLASGTFQACVIMSHHLPSDLSYLRVAAASDIPYVGLLGPPPRRERLLKDLGVAAAAVRERLHAPVGLDIGAHSPESIALSIVTEMHAALGGRRFSAPTSETPDG